MNTDITTVAIALPGYSDSSTNNFNGLLEKNTNRISIIGTKQYITFMSNLVKALKIKYNATTVNYIAHSAGAIVGATLTGYSPKLIQNIICVGGGHNIHKIMKNTKSLISLVDVIKDVDKNTKFLVIYGTKDTVSPSKRNINFYKLLINNGLNAKLIKINNAKHLDLDMTDTSIEAITEMLDY